MAVVLAVTVASSFVGMWWFQITTEPMPWWWAAVAVLFAAYWPIDRAFVQDRVRSLSPIVLRSSTGEIGIAGERFAMKSVEAIECVDVRYGSKGDEYAVLYHELHAIIAVNETRRRIVIVDEGMNAGKVAKELARMIGCAVRSVGVSGTDLR